MVLEQAVIQVIPGHEDAFEEAFSGVSGLLAGSPGCGGLHLYRCFETPGRYLLLVQWERLEDHLEGFRKSAAFQEYRGALMSFYAAPPAVEHYELRQER